MRRRVYLKAIATVMALIACIGMIFAAGCNTDGPANDNPGNPNNQQTGEETYTISFDTGVDGLTVEPITAAAGSKISAPTAPVRDGYRLENWLLDGEVYIFTTMPQANITLKASWIKTYTISFDTGAADYSIDPIVEPAGTKISAPYTHRYAHYLKNWLLDGKVYEFTVMPDRDITLVADWMEITSLPVMFIDLTDGKGNTVALDSVTREAYVNSTITIGNTEEEYEFKSLKSEFKGRGNGSWSGDKRGYKIKFDKKQSLFGRTKNKHWVIVACTNFNDTTLCRNYLAYNMANEVLDGIEYTTPAYWVDVYVNGDYRGVYILCEHVRVGEGRVDIESEYGVNDTGYLIEYDAYASGTEGIDYFKVDGLRYGFTVHSPDPEDYETEGGITKTRYMQQIAYIRGYVKQVVDAALNSDYATFSSLADVDSFVDMYILQELFKNKDAGWSSFYLYKKPGGKLYAGPAWDFDATANSSGGPEGLYVAGTGEGSVYQTANQNANMILISLYRNANFFNEVRTHWKTLSPAISAFIDSKINDAFYEEYKMAMGKNFAKWNNTTQSKAESTWVSNTKTLKKWLTDRIAWLDKEWA